MKKELLALGFEKLCREQKKWNWKSTKERNQLYIQRTEVCRKIDW